MLVEIVEPSLRHPFLLPRGDRAAFKLLPAADLAKNLTLV
jgi:hypothetical protein